jgi:tetratricopeptide (TPR) repeat protein
MFMRLATAILFGVLVISPAAGIARTQDFALAGQAQGVDSQAFLIRASSQFDLAMLYIKNGEPDKALAEARKIFQSPIPPEWEDDAVKSVELISGEFKQLRRYDLAHLLIDDAFKTLALVPNRVEILMFKSVLYNDAGEKDKAIETYKRAQALKIRR